MTQPITRRIFTHTIPMQDIGTFAVYSSSTPDDPGGAPHHYILHGHDIRPPIAEIRFQNGPVGEAGVNGVTDAQLLAVLIDRLQGFQRGPYACRENALTLTKLEEAMHWIHHRTMARSRRGVEGTSAK